MTKKIVSWQQYCIFMVFCKRLLVVVGLLLPNASLGVTIDFPDQKLLVGVPITTVERQTTFEKDSLAIGLGFGAEYSLFLLNPLSLSAQFQINLDQESNAIVFLGGAAGLTWYMVGGANSRHNDPYINSVARPKWNLYSFVGFGGKQFNFVEINARLKAAEPAPDPSDGIVVPELDPKAVDKGSVLGLQLAFAAELPVTFFGLLPGVRFQYFSAFSGSATPDLNITEIWVSCGFLI